MKDAELPKVEIAIIGGTGIYDPELLQNVQEVRVHTPYGAPSDLITVGDYFRRRVAVLPRHGRNHTIPPHMVNFRANIWALHELGAGCVIATAAAGSLREEMGAGDIVIPDQFIDLGKDVHTFYDGGQVCHVSLAEPFCPRLRRMLIDAAKILNIRSHEVGTYVRIAGPRFSTKSESKMFRQFGDIIGMTCIPEAVLCRELEMCFAVIATVTDYDVWADRPVNFEEIRKTMAQNLEKTKNILKEVVPIISTERRCPCAEALRNARV